MSEMGQKQSFSVSAGMSAFGGKADFNLNGEFSVMMNILGWVHPVPISSTNGAPKQGESLPPIYWPVPVTMQ